MKTTEFLQQLAEKNQLDVSVTESFLDALVETLQDALSAGHDVTLPGLGKFEAKVSAARAGRNPATGESIHIPAKTRLRFKPSAAWLLRLSNSPKKQRLTANE